MIASAKKTTKPTRNHLENAIAIGGKMPDMPLAINMFDAKKAGHIKTKSQAMLSFVLSVRCILFPHWWVR